MALWDAGKEEVMALRKIRQLGDKILEKPCREVKEMTPKIRNLVDDMLETMYDADGVGLAAPQVGVLKRAAVVDIGEGPIVLINPKLLESSGESLEDEGCLSLPGKVGMVRRPTYVRIEAYDEKMERFEMEARDLLARAVCHEMDHLDGHMYVEKVEGGLHDAGGEEEQG